MKEETISFFSYLIGDHKFIIIEYFNEEGDPKYYLTESGYGAIISNAEWKDVKDRLNTYHLNFLSECHRLPHDLNGLTLTQALEVLNKA